MTTPPPFTRCSQQVDRGASRVRSWHNFSSCEKIAVFTNATGQHFCATHAKGMAGYVEKPKAKRTSWRVFYTKPDGAKSWCYVWEAASERGARASFRRTWPDWTIVGVIPNTSDAEFDASPAAKEWKEFR